MKKKIQYKEIDADLYEEAVDVIDKIRRSGLKQGFISSQINLSQENLSLFMNLKPDAITWDKVNLLKKFIKPYEDKKLLENI